MVLLDDKSALANMVRPPAYRQGTTQSLPPFPGARPPATLAALPAHLVLRVVDRLLAGVRAVDGASRVERQRKVLYWMSTALRLVNRAFYVACMHILRSTYLPAYSALVKPPFTSDPFPTPPSAAPSYTSASAAASAPAGGAPLGTLTRETGVLDLFCALKVREDVHADESLFHLERAEATRDLFDLAQPRARAADLLRAAGAAAGVLSLPADSTMSAGGAGAAAPYASAFPFERIEVSFAPRAVGVVYATRTGKRTIVQVPRLREETLESSVKRLVEGLRAYLK